MSESSCKEILGQVYDYIDEALNDDQMSSVDGHLANCATCRMEYDIEIKISNMITSSSIEAQSDFSSKIRSRLDSEI
jgi:anti-sigma factor (TIGR02949 family)